MSPGSTLVIPCQDPPILGRGGLWTLLVVFFPPPSEAKHCKDGTVVWLFDCMGGPVAPNHITALRVLREELCRVRKVRESLLWKPDTVSRVLQSPQGFRVADSGTWIMAVARGILGGDPCLVPIKEQTPGLRVLLAAETLIGMRLPVVYAHTEYMRAAYDAKLTNLVQLAAPSEVCNTCAAWLQHAD